MKRKGIALLPCALILCLVFAACSPMAESSASSQAVSTAAFSKDESAYDAGAIEEGAEAAAGTMLDAGTGAVQVESNRKIIEYITLSAQTKEFDSLLEGIQQQITACGGYLESSSISGNEYASTGARDASFVIRVPSEKSGEFSDYISGNSTVTRKEVNTEDVTLDYVDTESRLSALRAEKESLEKLMRDASDLEGIIAIQERLTQVIYEIESTQSQLRTYDNLIDYTTITLYLSEVERTAVVEEQSVWQEIGTNISNHFEDMGLFFRGLFVGLASSLPYLLILALLAAIIWGVVKLCIRHRRKHPKALPPAYRQYPDPQEPQEPQKKE